MTTQPEKTKAAILAEWELARTTFHTLLASLSESDLRQPSDNPGWTNGEILSHMLFGFIILNALLPMVRLWGRLPPRMSKPFAWLLNALTGPFNWVNALGARWQARVFTYQRLGWLYDQAYSALTNQISSLKANEWERGMYYPTRWDSNFGDFMTVEKLLRYPVIHFNFHLRQIANTAAGYLAK